MKRKTFWILVLLYAWFGRDGVHAQQKQPVSSLQEDCGVTFNFTSQSSGAQAAGTTTAGSAGTTSVIDNQQTACLDWIVQYSTDTTVVAISLLFQVATDVGGIPGTWSAYPGTLSSGINPNTAVTLGGAVTEATGPKYPFLRMNLTSYTGPGNVRGRLIGWKRKPTGVVTVSGICPIGTPCVVVGNKSNNAVVPGATNLGVLPALANAAVPTWTEGDQVVESVDLKGNQRVTPFVFNGTTTEQSFICASQATITLSNATRTEIVALTASQIIRVCHIHMSTTAAENFTISYGTGSACGTGTTIIDDYLSVQAIAMDFQPTAALRTIASNALCVTQSGTQSAKVTVIYAKF